MLKKLSVTLFILSVTVSGVFASSFWQSLFGQNQSVFVDTVGFSSGNPQFDENVGNAVFTVTRSGDVGGAFSVDYATSDHQAIAPDDYTATSGILNFADGETSKQFSVPIIDDSIGEDLEFFAVTLSNPSNGVQIGNGSVFALIISDDMYFFNINQNSIESNEVFFNVERYGGNLNTTSTVSFATSDGTAIAGVDYIAQTGTLTFGPNETSKTITITYIDDVIIEPDETFLLRFQIRVPELRLSAIIPQRLQSLTMTNKKLVSAMQIPAITLSKATTQFLTS